MSWLQHLGPSLVSRLGDYKAAENAGDILQSIQESIEWHLQKPSLGALASALHITGASGFLFSCL